MCLLIKLQMKHMQMQCSNTHLIRTKICRTTKQRNLVQCNLSDPTLTHHLQEVLLNSLSSSRYKSDSSELVKVVLGTTGEVRLQYLSKQTSLQQIVCHWQQLPNHLKEILHRMKGRKKKANWSVVWENFIYQKKPVRNGHYSASNAGTYWLIDGLYEKQKAIKRNSNAGILRFSKHTPQDFRQSMLIFILNIPV